MTDRKQREANEIEAYEAALRRMEITDDALRISEYSKKRYAAPLAIRRLPVDQLFHVLGPVAGLHVLDCGCGDGEFSTLIGLLGAHVTGVDISERLVAIASRRAAINGVAKRVRFIRGSIHDLPFADGTFDAAFGKGVLHHVEVERAAEEISRTLKTGGRAIFEEPVALSGRLQRLRQSTPVVRMVAESKITPDERPLTQLDLDAFSAHFRGTEIHSMQLLARLERVFRSERALIWLNDCDRTILKILPGLKKFARLAILECRK